MCGCSSATPPGYAAARGADLVEVAVGAVTQSATLATALAGVTDAYYLVHSHGGARGHHEQAVAAARTPLAPRRAGLECNASFISVAGWTAAGGAGRRHASGIADTLQLTTGIPVTRLPQRPSSWDRGGISFEIVR